MRLILATLLFFTMTACQNHDEAAATGSGAGIDDVQKEQQNPESKDSPAEDMNITTPIQDRNEDQ